MGELARLVVGVLILDARCASHLVVVALGQMAEDVVAPVLAHGAGVGEADLAAQCVVAVIAGIAQRAQRHRRVALVQRVHGLGQFLSTQRHIACQVVAVARGFVVSIDDTHLAAGFVVLDGFQDGVGDGAGHGHAIGAMVTAVRCPLTGLVAYALDLEARDGPAKLCLRQTRELVVAVVRDHGARVGHALGCADLVTEGVVAEVYAPAVGLALLHHVAGQIADLGVEVAVGIAHADLAAQGVVVDARGGVVCRTIEAAQLCLGNELVAGVVGEAGLEQGLPCLYARVIHQGEVAPAIVFTVGDGAVAEVEGCACLGADLRGVRLCGVALHDGRAGT
ncbi:hypothetical protein BW39_00517 [Delftia sp. RIT313]|nr:hypothetical protein BW39_00517 [Delftia sp. RIT313]